MKIDPNVRYVITKNNVHLTRANIYKNPPNYTDLKRIQNILSKTNLKVSIINHNNQIHKNIIKNQSPFLKSTNIGQWLIHFTVFFF